jgi:hypothetical protein
MTLPKVQNCVVNVINESLTVCLRLVLFSGSAIAFFRGNVQKQLMDDVIALQPTILPTDPCLFDRITSQLAPQISSTPHITRHSSQCICHVNDALLVHY